MLGYDAILKRLEHDKKFNEILQEIAMLREEQDRLRQDMKDEFASVWDEITKEYSVCNRCKMGYNC